MQHSKRQHYEPACSINIPVSFNLYNIFLAIQQANNKGKKKCQQNINVIIIINEVFGFNSTVVQLEVIKYAIVVICGICYIRSGIQRGWPSCLPLFIQIPEEEKKNHLLCAALVGVRHENYNCNVVVKGVSHFMFGMIGMSCLARIICVDNLRVYI